MEYKVFISSTHNDIEVARDLARRLEEAGVMVFSVDKTAVPDANVSAAVTRSLREADEVLVILTDSSVNNPGIIFEMGAASGLHKRVTPIVVNVDKERIPPFVGKYVRFADVPRYISQLTARARAPKLQPA